MEAREELAKVIDKQADLVKKRTDLTKEYEELIAHEKALVAVVKWFGEGSFPIQKNTCSRLHKLADCVRRNNILCTEESKDITILVENAKIFVVEHDWAAAFGEALNSNDEFILPFDVCFFEFRLGGKTLIAHTTQEEGMPPVYMFFVDAGNDRWVAYVDEKQGQAFKIDAQIKAICVALDAEVAIKEVVRAPAALNKKIERTNRCKLYDYHVVKLRKRERVIPVERESNEPKTKKRLHFRRGHWRHFESHKTWIKWMLVGDPDLGFINKHYSL